MFLMMIQETHRRFVIRCKTSFNKEVIAFVNSNENSKIIELKPTNYAVPGLLEKGFKITTQTAIKVRMVKIILSSGEIEILLTSLYCQKLYSVEDFNFFYGLRWPIETIYGTQKNQLQMEQFSGHRVICIQQDYAASVFVANLQSLIIKQSEEYLQEINQTRKHNYKINKNVSLAAIKNNIVRLFINNEPSEILEKLQHVFEKNIEPIRPGRKFKRVIKVKYKRGKYRILTNYKRAI